MGAGPQGCNAQGCCGNHERKTEITSPEQSRAVLEECLDAPPHSSGCGPTAPRACTALDSHPPDRVEGESQESPVSLGPAPHLLGVDRDPQHEDLPGLAVDEATPRSISDGTCKPGMEDAALTEALEATRQCRFDAALRAAKRAKAMQQPILKDLPERVRRVKAVRAGCTEPRGEGWKRFDLELCTVWRKWDTKTGNIKIVMRWEALGSLLHQVAALRDADLLEPLWDGACWDITCQHSAGTTLVRWLQKDPFTGKKCEVILERVLCDCLDCEPPCWVLLERTPDLEGFETFTGKWKNFDIAEVPKGFVRSVTGESGRVLVPAAESFCAVTMALDFHVPGVVRWALTDSLLALGIRSVSKSSKQSWDKIIQGWGTCGFEERMRRDAAFYDPIAARIHAHLKGRPAT